MAHPRHQQVRQRFRYRCGYCGVSETEAGGELTVDHFQPVSAGGGDNEDNLVYACSRCNLFKGDFWPNAEDLQLGRRVIHPSLDDLTVHLQEDVESGLLSGLTNTGIFHIRLLQLNRPALVRRRIGFYLAGLQLEAIRLLEKENQVLRSTIEAQERLIALLRTALPADDEPK